MMFFGEQFNVPMYTLYQRERSDAPEPLSVRLFMVHGWYHCTELKVQMFWYNPEVTGDWWDGLALDHSFDDSNDTWVSMRASWTDPNQLYAGEVFSIKIANRSNLIMYLAMKAGKLEGHQTHGDLDVGDFVFEALGQRWA